MKKSSCQGFTLIELIVVVAVAAIVLTTSAPSFRDIIRNNRLAAQSNQMVTALNLARSEAIKRGVRVTLCKTANPKDSAPTCTTSGDWRQGWIAFVDNTQTTGNVAGVIDGADQRLRMFDPLSNGATLIGDANFQSWIAYRSNGVSIGASGAADGDIKLCQGVGKGKNINVKMGRIRTESETESATCS
jgi:type IV fimbrial biogenesis protein FimT